MKLIAKTQEGTEFLHSRTDCFFAPDSSAKRMCDQLNHIRYSLGSSSEKWWVYDYDYTQQFYVTKELFFSRGSLKSRSL